MNGDDPVRMALAPLLDRTRGLFGELDGTLSSSDPNRIARAIAAAGDAVKGLHLLLAEMNRLRELEQRAREQHDEAMLLDSLAALCESPPDRDSGRVVDVFADAATAVLLGQWELASRALTWLHAGPRRKGAGLSKVAVVLDDLAAGRNAGVQHLEEAVHRLQHGNEARRLRGALLVLLGRQYRDVVGSHELAASAFDEARRNLQRVDVEPLVERAELLRRVGRLEEAKVLADSASSIRPSRPGGWLVRALIAEDEHRYADVDELCQSGVEMLVRVSDPTATLVRLTPMLSRSATAFFSLARRLTALGTTVARRQAREALDLSLDPIAFGRIRGAARYAEAEAYVLRGELRRATGDADYVDDLYECGRRLTWRGENRAAVETLTCALAGRQRFQACAFQLGDALRMLYQDQAPSEVGNNGVVLRRAELLTAMAMRWQVTGTISAWELLSRAFVLEVAARRSEDDRVWKALVCAERALGLRRDDPAYLIAGARLHASCGNPRTAVQLVAPAHAVAPSHQGLAQALAFALMDAGRSADARNALEGISESALKRALHAFLILREKEDPAPERLHEVMEACESAISAGLDDDWVYLIKAQAARLLRDWSAATVAARVALARSGASQPRVSVAFRNEAAFWCREFDRAIAAADEGLRGPKDHAYLRLFRGLACLAQRRIAEGRQDLERSAEMLFGADAAVVARLFVSELEAIEELSTNSNADVRGELERAQGLFAARSLLPVPTSAVEELRRELGNCEAGHRWRRLALSLALARQLTDESPLAPDAWREANAALVAVRSCDSPVVEEANEMLDRRAEHLAQRDLVARDFESAKLLVNVHLEIAKEDPVRRARWLLGLASARALALLERECEDALATVNPSFRDAPQVIARVEAWLVSVKQATCLSRALRRQGWKSAERRVAEWRGRKLGLHAPPRLHAPAALSIAIPAQFQDAETKRAAQDAPERLGDKYGHVFPVAELAVDPSDFVISIHGAEVARIPAGEAPRLRVDLEKMLAAAIRPHMSDLIDLQDVARYVDSVGNREPPFAVHRLRHLGRLTRVLRELLREGISVKLLGPIAAAALHSRHGSLDDQVRRARARLPILEDVSDDALLVPVDSWVESVLGSKVTTIESQSFLAADAAEIDEILSSVELPTDGDAPILVTEQAAVRPWLRRVFAPVRADVRVFTRSELESKEAVVTDAHEQSSAIRVWAPGDGVSRD